MCFPIRSDQNLHPPYHPCCEDFPWLFLSDIEGCKLISRTTAPGSLLPSTTLVVLVESGWEFRTNSSIFLARSSILVGSETCFSKLFSLQISRRRWHFIHSLAYTFTVWVFQSMSPRLKSSQ